MKTMTKKLCLLFLVPLFALIVGICTFNMTTKKASANGSDFAMTTGASIRIEENNNGIRFQANISQAKYETVYNSETNALKDANVTFGMLIVPVDLMTGAGVSTTYVENYDYIAELSAKGVDYALLASTPQKDGENYLLNGSVSKLRDANCGRTYFGLAYVATVNNAATSYEYATFENGDNVRTMAQVAQSAIDSNKYENDTAVLGLLDGYIANATTYKFHAKSEVTCTENGYSATCWFTNDKYYTDSLLTQEIAENDVVVVATGHKGGTATVGKQAVCETCAQGYGSIAVTSLSTPVESVVGETITLDDPDYAESVTNGSISYRKYGTEGWTAVAGNTFIPDEIATYQVKYAATVDENIPFEAIQAISVVSPYTIFSMEGDIYPAGTEQYVADSFTVWQKDKEDGTKYGLIENAYNADGWAGWKFTTPLAMQENLQSTKISFEAYTENAFILPVEIGIPDGEWTTWIHRRISIPAGNSTVVMDFSEAGIVASEDSNSVTTLNGVTHLIIRALGSLYEKLYIDNVCYVPEDSLATSTPTMVREGGAVEFTAPTTTELGGTVNSVEVVYSKYGENIWTTLTADGNGNYTFTPEAIAMGKVEEVYQVKYTASVTNGGITNTVEQIDVVSVVLKTTLFTFDQGGLYAADALDGYAYPDTFSGWGKYDGYAEDVASKQSLSTKNDGTQCVTITYINGPGGFSFGDNGNYANSSSKGGYYVGEYNAVYFTARADAEVTITVEIGFPWNNLSNGWRNWNTKTFTITTTEQLFVFTFDDTTATIANTNPSYVETIIFNVGVTGNAVYIDNIGFGNPNA